MANLKILLLPFFLIRLTFSLTPFVIEVLFSTFHLSSTFILAVLVLLSQFFFTVSHMVDVRASLIQTQLVSVHNQQRKQALQQQQFLWEQRLQLQPTHRDVLLNSSKLACALGEKENCQRYYQAAFGLDPNNKLFAASSISGQ